ncbi:MAG: hypothetical protein IJW92_01240 [Clostridia bacterium]|nr:hypothetical protein [Clostridia bacterium]
MQIDERAKKPTKSLVILQQALYADLRKNAKKDLTKTERPCYNEFIYQLWQGIDGIAAFERLLRWGAEGAF